MPSFGEIGDGIADFYVVVAAMAKRIPKNLVI
jgi:hypothetical protein